MIEAFINTENQITVLNDYPIVWVSYFNAVVISVPVLGG